MLLGKITIHDKFFQNASSSVKIVNTESQQPLGWKFSTGCYIINAIDNGKAWIDRGVDANFQKKLCAQDSRI